VPASETVRRETTLGLTDFAIAASWGQLMFFGFIGLALFALPGFGAIDRRSLIAVVLIVLYLMGPLEVILNWLPALGRARASLGRVEALLPSLRAVEVDGLESSGLPPSFESIELDGICFAYDEGFALGPLDLTITGGELVILAGGNGAGKTTLVKLISGLYAPEAGTIRLDGRPVDEAGREAYRRLFSVVFADGHLFPDLLGLDDVADLEARAAEGLERLGLADEVAVLERRFSTVDLSQGRRRRLALLGALVEDRPILILDEWAANQDPRFKRAFYRELLPEWKAAGKTLLVISHDEAHFGVADRVIQLVDGQIAEALLPGRTH
jgi:putative ATP-binding cassette transporter